MVKGKKRDPRSAASLAALEPEPSPMPISDRAGFFFGINFLGGLVSGPSSGSGIGQGGTHLDESSLTARRACLTCASTLAYAHVDTSADTHACTHTLPSVPMLIRSPQKNHFFHLAFSKRARPSADLRTNV